MFSAQMTLSKLSIDISNAWVPLIKEQKIMYFGSYRRGSAYRTREGTSSALKLGKDDLRNIDWSNPQNNE